MLGEPLLRLEETDSTNRVALDWEDAPHGAGVVARAQTSGRGRLGRSWSSPAGAGLYLSLVLRPQRAGELALYSPLAALGVARALESLALEALAPLSFRLKWPNDVIVVADGQARKIGGLLCEARAGVIVVGIGLNLHHTRDQLPERPLFPASSLLLESGVFFETEPVLQRVLRELSGVFDQFEREGWASLRPAWEQRCYGAGEVVRVTVAGQTRVGVLAGADESGALLLKTADGWTRIVAGDVSYF